MFCHQCGIKNREEATFCRKCGNKLVKSVAKNKEETLNSNILDISPTVSIIEKIKEEKGELLKKIKYPKIKFGKLKSRFLIFGLAVVMLVVTLVPEAKAYYGYYKAMGSANKNFLSGNYSAAITDLQAVKDHGLYKTYKNKLKDTSAKYIRIKGYDEALQQAKLEKQNGNLDKAKEILNSISDKNEFPKLSEVNIELNIVNEQIAAKVKADADAKVSEAKQQAQEQTNKAQAAEISRQKAQAAAAQAAAQAAANKAAAEQAQQEAANQQAQAAAAQAAAQQAAQQRAEEVKNSFRNQLTTAYNSFNQTMSYYGSAISYSNNNQEMLALSELGSVIASLKSARESAGDLNSRFTGMPSSYYTAASNMNTAIDYLSKACGYLIDQQGSTVDYSTLVNSNKNQALYYKGLVQTFLSQNSY